MDLFCEAGSAAVPSLEFTAKTFTGLQSIDVLCVASYEPVPLT